MSIFHPVTFQCLSGKSAKNFFETRFRDQDKTIKSVGITGLKVKLSFAM